MFAKRLLAVRRLAVSSRQLSDHGHGVPEPFKVYERKSMTEIYPLPTITYKEAFDRQNAKFNRWLVASVLWFGSAVAFTQFMGTFDFLAPPPRKVLDWGQEADQ